MGLNFFDRRSRFVVNAALQRRIVMSFTLPMVIVLVVALGVQFFLGAQLKSRLVEQGLEVSGLLTQVVASIAFFVIASAYLVITSLRNSHRVAGASYRIQETLKTFRGGDRKIRANLRKDDYLMALADDVNAFLDWLEGEAGEYDARQPVRAETPSTAHQDSSRSPARSGVSEVS
jgi:hypothetical protein